MLVEEYDYDLPARLIAQSPAPERDSSRLMVLHRGERDDDKGGPESAVEGGAGRTEHRRFGDLPDFLAPGDTLVINDTKVYPARLAGFKKSTGGKVEALISRELGPGRYEALIKGGPKEGALLVFGGAVETVVEKRGEGGLCVLGFGEGMDVVALLEEFGRMPLPPYIDQGGRAEQEDRERYQTVYAANRGAVAAPTAGLHFTERLLDVIRQKGVSVVNVTLHVGPGTFLPVRSGRVEEHIMHEEAFEITERAAGEINRASSEGGRVVAVGTTSLRAVESASDDVGTVRPGAGSTGLFIYPGYRFKAVDALITNFHLPRSTLLMLVSALAGRQRTLAAYREAVGMDYRFYSYGDAMLVL